MTRIGIISAVSTLALALAACGEKAPQEQANAAPAQTPVTAPAISADQAFANTAASSDAFEIQTSNLAAEKSESSAIQAFAKQMIAAHTDSTAKLKAAAAGASPAMTPDPMLTADQQSRLSALQAKSGADFNTSYAQEQVAAHQATLAALRAYAANGAVPQLKDFASRMTPIVTAHLNMAKSLKP